MSEGKDYTQMDIVIHIYNVTSIKEAERYKRDENDVFVFKEILFDHNIKHWVFKKTSHLRYDFLKVNGRN